MSDEEFNRKAQQLRNDGDDDFADAIDGLRAEITAERQASKRVVADGLAFRDRIAALLPESWYADLPLEERFQLLVEQWRKLQRICEVELTRATMADAERKHSIWLQSECDKAVNALYQRNAEVSAAMEGLHSKWLSAQARYAFAYDKSDGAAEIARRIAELNAVITKLGLALAKDGVNE